MVQTNYETGITRRLAEFASGLNYEDLSPAVVDWAKYLCLDFAGVTLNGSTTASARAVTASLRELGRPGPSVIVGSPYRTLPEYASLANGVAFHSIEMDDVNNEASLHPGVVAYPTALSLADLAGPEGVSGRDFIAAVVAGYEVIVRLGRALKPAEHYGRGFHPTGTCGAFGAAAVAGRLLRLPEASYLNALGIAGSQAAGSMEYLAQGAWTKRLHPGWAAHSGTWAALLARHGYTGPATILEGRDGFLQAYSGDPDPQSVVEGLGEEFLITRTGVKPHSCCRYSQGPIDCLLELKRAHGLEADEVEGVTVAVLAAGAKLVADPSEEKANPQSVVDMQFSMPFGAAVALAYGRASLAEFAEGVPQRPEIRRLLPKVRCVTDPELEAYFPKEFRAWAEVETADGRQLRSAIRYPKGDPENALSWEEMRDKFLALTAPVISEPRQQEIIAAIESLDQLDDIRHLGALLAGE